MRLGFRYVTVMLAAILAPGASALAQNTVEIAITPGTTLTASLNSDVTMTVANFSLAEQRTTGTLTLRVEDGRGTQQGWRVTIAAGDFVSGDARIPASGFSFSSPGALHTEIGETTGIGYGEPGTSLSSSQMVMYAVPGAGTGIYRQELNVALEIPAQTPAGTYRSEVTVSIISAPGS